uniref:Uncharacterized protein n=1 Tax=biofilter metagenome TaxID=1070537 RepID=A0A193SBQ7_9ZZZZ
MRLLARCRRPPDAPGCAHPGFSRRPGQRWCHLWRYRAHRRGVRGRCFDPSADFAHGRVFGRLASLRQVEERFQPIGAFLRLLRAAIAIPRTQQYQPLENSMKQWKLARLAAIPGVVGTGLLYASTAAHAALPAALEAALEEAKTNVDTVATAVLLVLVVILGFMLIRKAMK